MHLVLLRSCYIEVMMFMRGGGVGEERGERERGRVLGHGSPTTELPGKLVKNLSTVSSEAISCKAQFYR